MYLFQWPTYSCLVPSSLHPQVEFSLHSLLFSRLLSCAQLPTWFSLVHSYCFHSPQVNYNLFHIYLLLLVVSGWLVCVQLPTWQSKFPLWGCSRLVAFITALYVPGFLNLCSIFSLGLIFPLQGCLLFDVWSPLLRQSSVPGSLTLFRIFYLGFNFSPLGLFHFLTSVRFYCGNLLCLGP